MRLFHRTWAVYASDILEAGFVDGAEGFVWMSGVPLDSEHIKGGQSGDVSIVVTLPDEVFQAFPPVARNGYREFKIPAEHLNMGKVRLNATDYAGMSRNQIMERIKQREALEEEGRDVVVPGNKFGTARTLREAIFFLDKFGPLA
jgi:hypothetical protein